MNLRSLACRRYASLRQAEDEGRLGPRGARFLDGHLEDCEACRSEFEADDVAFSALREAAFQDDDIVVTPGFDDRILRQVRINAVREGFRYWSPAAVGASIACLAIFAALHLASAPNQSRPVDFGGGQARNAVKRAYPTLELDRIPEFRR